MTKVGVLVGSLREGSYARKWAEEFTKLLPEDFEVTFLEIGNLPLYSEEYDENEPAEYASFRAEAKAQDAIVISTPEYNRSTSAVLKNALDVGSRPYGSSVWDGKPTIIIGHSISNISGANAIQSLRPTLAFLNMPVLSQPEVQLANSQKYFDDAGNLNNEGTKAFLQGAADAYVTHVKRYVD